VRVALWTVSDKPMSVDRQTDGHRVMFVALTRFSVVRLDFGDVVDGFSACSSPCLTHL